MPPKAGKGGKVGKGRSHDSSEAFSGQKKKAQLQSKREKQRQKRDSDSEVESDGDKEKQEAQKDRPAVVTSFGGNCSADDARLSSMFARENDESVSARRSRGGEPLDDLAEKIRLVAEPFIAYVADVSSPLSAEISQGLKLPHPVRPKWTENMSPAALAKQEADYFNQWCRSICSQIEALGSRGADVGPFELNLEVWRQLWRVIEQSDVVVLIVDVRNPTFHIPPSLVNDVIVTHRKRLVIVLSKCDLVSEAFVQRWRKYLSSQLPGIGVVEFMSRFAEDPPGGERGAGTVSARRRWLSRRCRQTEIDSHLNHMAKRIMESVLGTTCTEAKRAAIDLDVEARDEVDSSGETGESVMVHGNYEKLEVDGDRTVVGKGPNGALAIGLVGHPNVGKTSVLNALAGRKAASVSGTAGHTKHLQHIRIDETVHTNAFVIDCPGLVFPSLHSRAQAELNGLLPIAQVRETMSAVRVIAESISLPKALALKMPEWYDDDAQWTPQAILEAHAEKHRYYLPRSGAPDVHRAGLEILKDAKDGAILLAYDPPG